MIFTGTSGGAPTPTLQWQTRPVGLTGSYANVTGANITGAQTASLTISGITAANIGDYVLFASNNVSTALSSPVRVLVIQPSNSPALIGEWINGQNNANEVTGQYNHAHDGVASGSVAFQTGSGNVPPGFSSSLYSANFNGSSAIIVTNSKNADNDYRLDFDNNITNRFTVAFWAQGFPTSANGFLGKNGTANTQGWRVEHDSNEANVNQFTLELPGLTPITGQGTTVPQQLNDGAGVAVTDSNWHHYCATYDSFSGEVYLYLDGVCVEIFDRVYPSVTVANANHFAFGASEAGGSLGGFFTGSLFDVRLYNYAVQPGEVQAMISPLTTANTIGLYLGSTNKLTVGSYTTLSVILPAGANSGGPVTVTIANGAPAVADIIGSSTLTFAQNGALVQTVDVQALGPGTISFTATALGLTAGNVTDMVAVQVVEPALIGWWFNGSQTLNDQSGYLGAPGSGVEDGVASTTAIGGGTATYIQDAPANYPAATTYALTNSGNNCVSIEGTSLRDTSSTYTPTFDDDLDMGFSCAFWAKGVPSKTNGWFSKNGQYANVAGWMMRNQGGNLASFTVRYAAGAQNNEENPDMDNSTNAFNATGFNPTSTWHHWAGTYDGVAGLTKLYVDGNLSATLPNNYGPIAAPVDSCLVIGAVDNADNQNTTAAPAFANFFNGEMFDVRMYNYPLAASEVQSIFAYNPASPVNLSVVADTPVIDLTNTGMVSITLPTMPQGNSPISQTVVIRVTNSNPAVVSIAGEAQSIFNITIPSGSAYQTVRLVLTGLANGSSTISAGAIAGGSTVYGSAQATVNVYGPQLVARWFVGLSNLFEYSGFRAAHAHDGTAVTGASGGNSAATALYTPAGVANSAPPGFPGASVTNPTTYSIIIDNSDGVQGCLFANGSTTVDPAYQSTFDNVLANHFTVAFWANLPTVANQGNWTAIVGKGGEPASDNGDKGWQVRKDGTGSPPRLSTWIFPARIWIISVLLTTAQVGCLPPPGLILPSSMTVTLATARSISTGSRKWSRPATMEPSHWPRTPISSSEVKNNQRGVAQAMPGNPTIRTTPILKVASTTCASITTRSPRRRWSRT